MGESTKKVNCTSCNKQLKIVKRYYRNGKYFCNKNCYKTFKNKQAQEANKDAAQ